MSRLGWFVESGLDYINWHGKTSHNGRHHSLDFGSELCKSGDSELSSGMHKHTPFSLPLTLDVM